MMNQAERELMNVDQQESETLKSEDLSLKENGDDAEPNTPILSVTGERILDSVERLRALRAEYVGAAPIAHPKP